jgi:hypothetical protein
MKPQVVMHLAVVVGGIGANRAHPGRVASENLVMGAMLMARDVPDTDWHEMIHPAGAMTWKSSRLRVWPNGQANRPAGS